MNQTQYDRLYGDEFHQRMLEWQKFVLERSLPSYIITTDNTNDLQPVAAPAETCAHDDPLIKVTNGIAYCDGCGRSFDLREFGS